MSVARCASFVGGHQCRKCNRILQVICIAMTTTMSTFKSVFYLHIYTGWYSSQSCFTYIQVGTIVYQVYEC